jgi:hypothetical protein
MQRAARPFRCLPARRASFLVDPFGDGTLHAKMKIAVGAVGQKGFPVMAITVTNERGEVVLCVAKAPRLTGGAARLVTLKKTERASNHQ